MATVYRHVQVPVIGYENCRKAYAFIPELGLGMNVTRDMLCAGDLTNGGMDACQVSGMRECRVYGSIMEKANNASPNIYG